MFCPLQEGRQVLTGPHVPFIHIDMVVTGTQSGLTDLLG